MGKRQPTNQVRVMGVINTTPDSFSDGGKFDTTEKALRYAMQLIDDGVDILDIGGESTRPGSQNVDASEELARTIPLIQAIRKESDVQISIDTNKPVVMQQAVAEGANLINSIWALRQDDVLAVAAQSGAAVCLMHMQGTPETMQQNPCYDDVVSEVIEYLRQRIEAAVEAGIARENIIVDPGFGFGKTLQHNLLLLKSLAQLKALDVPLLVGLSRKSMIGTILNKPVDQRLYGSISTAVIAAMQGADIIRVHDVAQTIDALAIVDAVNGVQTQQREMQ
ncbi:MAG: dihydropteroate synthase [Gammaproteobacteria bacterium]|nr:MAG: dihydropteroate synthase [Gammaproteobacteria bacterium]